MIILDRFADDTVPDTGTLLEFLLAGASVTALPFVTSFVEFQDVDQNVAVTLFNGVSNGVTPVTILEPPTNDGYTRQLKALSVYNPNVASATVTIRLNDNATTRIIIKTILDTDDTLQYNDGEGFRVIDKDGNIKTVVLATPAEVSKLAQSNPSAASLTDAYTVPALTYFTGKVIVINRSTTPTTFRLSLAPNGAADANSQYMAFDTPIGPNDIYESPVFDIDAADVVRVYATLATLTFTITGKERAV